MKKLTSTLTILGLAVAMTTSTFATTVQPVKYPVSVDILTQMKSTQPYIWDGKFVDVYGNYVEMNDKWEKNVMHKTQQMSVKPNSAKTINGIRPGYKPAKLTLQVNNPQTVVIQPTSTTQVTMGKVVIPEGLPKDNWWLSLTSDSKTEARDVVLKVKEDGSFKFLNLQDGKYEVEIFRGTHTDSYIQGAEGCFWNKTYTAKLGNIDIKGNINKTFDITNSVIPSMSINTYFIDKLDYSTPENYTGITPYIELDDGTKKLADAKFNDNKDITTVKEILQYMLDNYHDAPSGISTDPDLFAMDVVKQGYATTCGQYESLFQAFARYKGIPTVSVSTVDIDWANKVSQTQTHSMVSGHAYVECYVDGKWILVDPTGCSIFENYNPTEQSIYTMPTDNGDKYFYAMAKSKEVSAQDHSSNLLVSIALGMKGNIEDLTKLPIIKPTKIIGN